jgi:putative transposase
MQKRKSHPNADKKAGIDVGLESFATPTTREQISNPRYLVNTEKKLKKFQSRVSRKVKGSRNRGKAVQRLARAHQKVFDQRRDFLHKLSRFVVDEFGTIAVEDLNIEGMVKNHRLAKHISDASWDSFFQMLCHKASRAGGRVLKNPRTKGSTLGCFNCGREVPKSLATRIHACPFCGVSLHRDYNSALVHLKDTVGFTGSSRLWRSYLYNHPPEAGCKWGHGSRNHMRPSSISRSRWKPTTLAVGGSHLT